MSSSSTDRIEKKILLRASRDRVWRAISHSTEFGAWFGLEVVGPFKAGAKMSAAIVGTKVNDEVAAAQKKHAGIPFELYIEKIEPQRLFSFRWHPHAVERGVNYDDEATTLVTFTLDDAPGGILLTVTETGFDKIPLERRAKAFTANDNGWAIVITLVEEYLKRAS
jgi:uncharacterized protein YndB with AHSA1/START domain